MLVQVSFEIWSSCLSLPGNWAYWCEPLHFEEVIFITSFFSRFQEDIFLIFIYLFLCVWSFVCTYVCTPVLCLLPAEARRQLRSLGTGVAVKSWSPVECGLLKEQLSHLARPSCRILHCQTLSFRTYGSLSRAGLLNHSLSPWSVSISFWVWATVSLTMAFVKFSQMLGSLNFIFGIEHWQLFSLKKDFASCPSQKFVKCSFKETTQKHNQFRVAASSLSQMLVFGTTNVLPSSGSCTFHFVSQRGGGGARRKRNLT